VTAHGQPCSSLAAAARHDVGQLLKRGGVLGALSARVTRAASSPRFPRGAQQDPGDPLLLFSGAVPGFGQSGFEGPAGLEERSGAVALVACRVLAGFLAAQTYRMIYF
jgi:hypothetical protein